jgi:hypothetical protein
LTTEFIFAIIRKHTINEGFLVSGMLIPLIMPIDVPCDVGGRDYFLQLLLEKKFWWNRNEYFKPCAYR